MENGRKNVNDDDDDDDEVSHLKRQPMGPIMIDNKEIDVVDKFCYLGDMISAEGGAEESIVTRIRCGWKKFRELLPLLTTKGFSLRSKGAFYQACIRSVIIYGGETWAVREEDLSRLERNDMMMIRWMCNVSLKDRIPSGELRARLGLLSEIVYKSTDYSSLGMLKGWMMTVVLRNVEIWLLRVM